MIEFLSICFGCFIGNLLGTIIKAILVTYCKSKTGYYVYMPSKDKPTVIYTKYINAYNEAERLYNKFGKKEDVMILKIDRVFWCR